MDYSEAALEERRISGLLESNQHYEYRTTVQPYYDEVREEEEVGYFAGIAGYFVGVAWYVARYDEDDTLHEYGICVAVMSPGTSVGALKEVLHQSYVSHMAQH